MLGPIIKSKYNNNVDQMMMTGGLTGAANNVQAAAPSGLLDNRDLFDFHPHNLSQSIQGPSRDKMGGSKLLSGLGVGSQSPPLRMMENSFNSKNTQGLDRVSYSIDAWSLSNQKMSKE